jgi:tRNA modification GTPase
MTAFDPHDTIAAIASPPGFGFRGIVRVSGPGAWPVALAGFAPEGGEPPRRAGRHEGAYRLDGLGPALPAAVVLGRGPRTYTGQDLAEIHTLGSPPLLQHLLAHCLARGARPAGPGEFTLRAFLSGRIDLTRAEAVLGVIDARTPAQLDAALAQLAGGLAAPVAALRDRLLDVLAHLEAGLDFVDEPDVDTLDRHALAESLAASASEITSLADRLRARDRPGGFPVVVLVGPPNAGKSRLFNALVGESRALVSPRPGTTRDYLSALCDCDGLTVELIDTAGEEPAATPIDALAQSLRADQAARADLLLICTPADAVTADGRGMAEDRGPRAEDRGPRAEDRGPRAEDRGPRAEDRGPRADSETGRDSHLSAISHQASVLPVLTKSDLSPGPASPLGGVITSAETGEGLDRLRRSIAAALRARASDDDPATTTGARCRDSLARAGDALASAAETLALGGGDELVAVDLRQAVDELGKVVGAVVTDDILDRIFRRFCIGK